MNQPNRNTDNTQRQQETPSRKPQEQQEQQSGSRTPQRGEGNNRNEGGSRQQR
ncbi:MAG: hypothetical protein IBJ04_06955 [Hydrogenophaga sp.]|uniref:Uncharacterized protein n=1 Tax=Hydrogenophaga crocea TaxID=2716225 RepID=A0A6G8IFN7_9BURK|nr:MULTISPECIES: hypothetical protein [Hydrogenophaga]MBL0944047.1 hypothetical protein [Hydrogenophaga sp.]QIM51790.1 hypothetical protein G9Q37_06370 [Hydrogenophaga crocea]